MDSKRSYLRKLHYNMAFIGGFFGLYAIYTRNNIFGSAQTGNLISLVEALCLGNITDIFIRLGGLFLYSFGIFCAIWIPKHFSVDTKMLSVFIDSLSALLLGFLPQHLHPVLALYPVFFAMSFQWCSFKGIENYNSATTFSTNNLRQFITALTDYCETKDNVPLMKMKYYGYTLAFFHCGAGAACILSGIFCLHSIWFCCVPLTTASFLIIAAQKAVYTETLSGSDSIS